jgi:hypothetical protein
MEIRNKIINIENEINKLYEQESKIIKEVGRLFKFDCVKRVIVGYNSFSHSLNVRIRPSSAWADVIEFDITKDKNLILKTSSGGWNDRTKSFEETLCILKSVEKLDKKQLFEYRNEIEDIHSKATKMEVEINKLQKLEEEQKVLNQVKGMKELSQKDLDKNKITDVINVKIIEGGTNVKDAKM